MPILDPATHKGGRVRVAPNATSTAVESHHDGVTGLEPFGLVLTRKPQIGAQPSIIGAGRLVEVELSGVARVGVAVADLGHDPVDVDPRGVRIQVRQGGTKLVLVGQLFAHANRVPHEHTIARVGASGHRVRILAGPLGHTFATVGPHVCSLHRSASRLAKVAAHRRGQPVSTVARVPQVRLVKDHARVSRTLFRLGLRGGR